MVFALWRLFATWLSSVLRKKLPAKLLRNAHQDMENNFFLLNDQCQPGLTGQKNARETLIVTASVSEQQKMPFVRKVLKPQPSCS